MLKLYDTSLNLKAYLENAFSIWYEQRDNEIWTAGFSLPADDPKVSDIQDLYFVEIYDGDDRIDLFRISKSDFRKSNESVMDYICEHCLVTLLDDVLFQYHQQTDTPTNLIAYILGYQSTARWQAGTVNFVTSYAYKWENENLLSALFSLPKAYNTSYRWTWDTSSYPWTLNLVTTSATISAYIRYAKNLKGIKRERDNTELRTRLYVLGYGEGVNQLNIKSVNAGVEYIDASTIGTYGTIADFYIDKEEESATTLLAKAQARLEEIKNPIITYSFDAAEVYQITNESIDKFTLGSLVRVIDDDLGTIDVRVKKKSKKDVTGAPGDVQLELTNLRKDIADTTANLQRGQRISETYAQGAVNLDSNDFQDNCDNGHGAVVQFFIPAECVNINKCMLSYKVDKFRAYAGVTEGGGGSTETSSSGGGSTETSSSGGADTYTSEAGGSATTTDSSPGGTTSISVSAGSYLQNMGTSSTGAHDHTGEVTNEPDHSHDVYDHEHSISVNAHSHNVASHAHEVNTSDHTHDVTIPNHTHDVTIPDHTHDIAHEISEFANLPPSVVVKVDGNTVPGVTGLTGTNINIISYLDTSGGKITRDAWHTVEIIPDTNVLNPLGLARIFACVIKQLFLQSRGGVEY